MRDWEQVSSYHMSPDAAWGLDWDLFLDMSDVQEQYLSEARRRKK